MEEISSRHSNGTSLCTGKYMVRRRKCSFDPSSIVSLKSDSCVALVKACTPIEFSFCTRSSGLQGYKSTVQTPIQWSDGKSAYHDHREEPKVDNMGIQSRNRNGVKVFQPFNHVATFGLRNCRCCVLHGKKFQSSRHNWNKCHRGPFPNLQKILGWESSQ